MNRRWKSVVVTVIAFVIVAVMWGVYEVQRFRRASWQNDVDTAFGAWIGKNGSAP